MFPRSTWTRIRLQALGLCVAAIATPAVAGEPVAPGADLDGAFHAMYELRFDLARERILAWRTAHPDDPLGPAAEAASHLFEELDRQGVLTSAFFLDDDLFLGGIQGKPDPGRRSRFLAAIDTARTRANALLKANPKDPDGLFVLTLANGMQGDFEAIIEKRQLAALSSIKRAEKTATLLLEVRPDLQDASLALGAANYIIGSLPGYKRFFLWFGGVSGDRERGMRQLQMAADQGRYLRAYAKALLALALEREGRFDRASALFAELAREFPANPSFTRELALAQARSAASKSSSAPGAGRS
jgi:tetratricopeptide (TPR) repeat protein